MWLSGKEPTCRCRRLAFCPWLRDIPWRRKWQPTPVFLLGNPGDRGTWKPTVQGGAKSRTQLRIHTLKEKVNLFFFFFVLYLCVILAAVYLCLSVFVYMVKQNWSKKSYSVWFRVSNREEDAYLRRVIPWFKGKSLDHEYLPSPFSGLRAPGTHMVRASIPRILHTCLQPSSRTHPALVSLHSKCLAVRRSSGLRKEGLRVELEV